MDLPVVTECGASTLIHERYNAQWVEEHQVGVVIKNFKQVHRAVEQFLDLGTFAHYRAKAAAIENRAVFEITDESVDPALHCGASGDSLTLVARTISFANECFQFF